MSKPQFTVSREAYSNQRPQKITQRPIRKSEHNPSQENQLTEQKAYNEYYALKRAQYAEFEQRAMARIAGSPEEKAKFQQEYNQELQENEYARLAKLDAERAENARIERAMIEQVKYNQIMDEEQEKAKREYAEYLAQCEQNELQAKNARILQEREEELMADRGRPEFFQGHFQRSLK